MSSINPETVVSVLKDQIENYDQKTEVKEEGRIIQIADGIATGKMIMSPFGMFNR